MLCRANAGHCKISDQDQCMAGNNCITFPCLLTIDFVREKPLADSGMSINWREGDLTILDFADAYMEAYVIVHRPLIKSVNKMKKEKEQTKPYT